MFDLEFLYYAALGVAGGVFGGMGMGGGTVLIPMLIIFLSTPQRIAQTVNLITFIPMAIVVLIVHVKNKLVKYNDLLYLILPAAAFAVASGLLATVIDGEVLKKVFGGFLIALSVVQFFSDDIAKIAKNRKK